MRIVIAIIAICVFLDQASKIIIQKMIPLHESIPLIPMVSFHHVTNKGGAFGIFSNIAYREEIFIIISILALVVLVYLFWITPKEQKLMRSALALIAGGAFGNLYDRIRFGEVVDFIEIGVNRYRWPTFNIADIAITMGVILVLYETIRSQKIPPEIDVEERS